MPTCIAAAITISIDRPWQDVYDAIWRPEAFPAWAAGLSRAKLVPDGESWIGETPTGRIHIRFTGHNPFGIMDHWVDTGTGPEIYVPLRVVANGNGAEVTMTLFHLPHMTAAECATDAAAMAADLRTLRALLTA
jgi:hypothetical protein